MPKSSTRRLLYAMLLVFPSVVASSVVFNNDFDKIVAHIGITMAQGSSEKSTSVNTVTDNIRYTSKETNAPLPFTTIIQNADEQVGCSNNGFTVARFNLCGDADDRTITLSGGPYTTVEWQLLGGSCTPDTNADCPNTDLSCYNTVATGASFNLQANTIPAGTGAAFRVVADGQQYYFKVKKSTITQTYVKRDYICGVDGRIQITNLSSAYEFSINAGTGFGAWQSSPIFDGLAPGTYMVQARLQNTPNTCEYPYEPIVIEQQDIDIAIQFTDAQCAGDTGSITVTVTDVPGPFRYTLLDDVGLPIEFTTFITTNPYTFSAVGFGTYSVQVETQQCTGDPANGILAPQQSVDINGNAITIGNGIVPLLAATEVNESLSSEPGCGAATVPIIVRPSGGTAPYTFTVSDGGSSNGSFTNETTYTVSTAGTYDFDITDANGCTISASANVQELTPPDISVIGIDGNCTNGGARLQLTVIDAKGYNLLFRAAAADAWSSDPLLSVGAGTYNGIQVQYEQGGFSCFFTLPDVITVTETGAINGADPTATDLSCNGTATVDQGTINFPGTYTGAGGGPFEFSIDGTNFYPQQLFNGLAAGTYNPAVRNASGCRRDFTAITIAGVDPPTDIDFVQSNTNCTANTADVQLSPTANVAIVSYEVISPVTINNGANNTFTGLSNNVNHVFRITDANGCTYQESFTPALISTIRARVASGGDLNVCTGATDGSGSFFIDGFANNYTYNINGGAESAPQNNPRVTINNLAAGNYTITVTDADSGCQDATTLTVQEPSAPLSLVEDLNPMRCANNNIGRVRAVATGGFGAYRYELVWPAASGVGTQGPQSGAVFGNLTASGQYTLRVTDAENCSVEVQFSLNEVNAPSIALGAVDYCFSPTNDAAISVTSTAGSAPLATHQYRINGGALQASPNFTGLVPGTYTITVEDAIGCSDQLQLTIPPQIQIALDVITEIPCGGDGAMEIAISGGDTSVLASSAYTIFLDGTPVAGHTNLPLPANPFNYVVPFGSDGTYTVAVTDVNGCTNTSPPLDFSPPANITATETIVGPSCGDASSGYISVNPDVSAGTPPFEVVFAPAGAGLVDDPFNPDPSGVYNFASQTLFSGLTAGNYEYIVKDARNCTTGVRTVTVAPDASNPPDATVTPNTANCLAGVVSGGVTISAITDGLPNFIIVVEDLFGNEFYRQDNVALVDLPLSIDNLPEGNYNVITLDARGCIDQDVVSVDAAAVSVVPTTVLPLTCSPAGFTYCVDIVGGTGPFQIRRVQDPPIPFVSLGGTAPTVNRSHCFNNVGFGESFAVEIVDTATGCTYEELIEIPEGPSTVNVDLTVSGASCAAGMVTIDWLVTGATGNMAISIQNLDTGAIVYNDPATLVTTGTLDVPSGPYAIRVADDGTGCTDGDTADAIPDYPRVDVIANQNANCNALGQLTVRGSGGTPYPPSGPGALPDGSPYEYAFVIAGTVPTAADYGTATTVNLAGALAPGTAYDIWVQDARGCAFMTSATVVQLDPDLPEPIIAVDNQCDVTPPVGGFQINLEMPASVANPAFTLAGQTQVPAYDGVNPTIATFNVPSVGTYDVYVVDANGCDVRTTAEVFQLLSASGSFSVDPTCQNPDGEITINVNGGSGDFRLTLTGVDYTGSAITPIIQNNDDVFTGLATNAITTFANMPPGTYEVQIRDNRVTDGVTNCTTVVNNIIAQDPEPPIIDDTGATNISCNGANDGSISVVLRLGTDVDGILAYSLFDAGGTLVASNTSGNFAGLGPGTYRAAVETNRGCTVDATIPITEPAVFEITAADATLSCANGSNRFSTTTISAQLIGAGNGAPYGYRLDPNDSYQSSPDFEIVDNGSDQTITIYAIDANGCEDSATITVFAPTDVVPSLATLNNLTCADPERVTVSVVGTNNFTIITTAPSGVTVANVNVTGSNTATVALPEAGDYLLEVQDNSPNGCSYPLPRYTVNAPVSPVVTIAEAGAVRCFGDNSGSLFIDVTDYSGLYTYEAFLLDAGGNRITPAQATGSFDTANYPDVNGNMAQITGLLAGIYEVAISTQADPQCPAVSNVATVRSPNGPLVPDAMAIGTVGCNDDSGVIEANVNGGWDYAAYEYRLLLDADADGVYETEVHPWGTDLRFQDLASGVYQVGYRDVEGCSTTFDITLDAVPPIQVGIREPQGLVCPDGNNAVLEAFDPNSGSADTANAGASGGVAGAGYKYQLIYLGSNDVTDEVSRSGLQDSPTFSGASGGFISQGWYAIEVSSSADCIGFTQPYFVDPPPPIIPHLVQVLAPGCGGNGQMRLSIENPEIGFEYEYRLANTAGGLATDPFIVMQDNQGNPSAAVVIDGVQGFYQYEVRKVNANNTCGTVNSNGLTLVDAQNITLWVNQPDDISCANEIDGRIESFASGGIGQNTFTLYLGDPVDAFNPSANATLVVSNDFGTFEGLGEATNYYIAVTSGISCADIAGPFTVSRPDPIVYSTSTTAVSCYAENDGTVTIAVTSGGDGLVQFAISPNFNEFFSDPNNPGTYTFTGLAGAANGQEYTILIQDAQGCSETAVVAVMEPQELQLSYSQTPEICMGFADGSAQLSVSGGTPFVDANGTAYYEVAVNSLQEADFVRNDSMLFQNLAGGQDYAFFVRDANGCMQNVVVSIDTGVNIDAAANVIYGCEGIFPNSTTTIVPLNGAALEEVLVALDVDDINQATEQREWGDLPPGDHTAYLYHPNGCTTMVAFTIDAYDPLSVVVTKTAEDEVTALVTGGFGDYEFFFQGNSQGGQNVFHVNFDTTITVRVQDAQGCFVEVVFPFNFEGMPEFPNYFTPDGDGLNDVWYPRNRENFPGIEVVIYDRYGRVVAHLDEVTKWDGTYEGLPLPTGDYWYVVNANDQEKQQFVGHFTLYR